jgi:hypothetical protein
MEWIVSLLVLLIIFAIAFYIIDLLISDARMKNIARAIMGLFILIILIGLLFGAVPFPAWPNR